MTSEQFKAHRLQLHLTQETLGAIMGMSRKHISRIESGERQPTKIQAAFVTFIVETKRGRAEREAGDRRDWDECDRIEQEAETLIK